jgi:hypothetical protein
MLLPLPPNPVHHSGRQSQDCAGWGIPAAALTPLILTVGGIGTKHEILDGRMATRKYLSLTISVDHDIVDGAPAARFTERSKELIESGYGLDDFRVESEAATHSPMYQQR